jgi:hypothetical protein
MDDSVLLLHLYVSQDSYQASVSKGSWSLQEHPELMFRDRFHSLYRNAHVNDSIFYYILAWSLAMVFPWWQKWSIFDQSSFFPEIMGTGYKARTKYSQYSKYPSFQNNIRLSRGTRANDTIALIYTQYMVARNEYLA